MEEPGTIIKKRAGGKSFFIYFILLLFALVIFIIFNFYKQKQMETRSSVKGILHNTAGLPVADAVVMIIDGSHEFNDIASVSNEKGEFFVSNIVIPGRYVLQIQHDSNSITKEININTPDTILQINF